MSKEVRAVNSEGTLQDTHGTWYHNGAQDRKEGGLRWLVVSFHSGSKAFVCCFANPTHANPYIIHCKSSVCSLQFAKALDKAMGLSQGQGHDHSLVRWGGPSPFCGALESGMSSSPPSGKISRMKSI